ncbi:MAG: GNAT family N-acetyltransferase [Desulfobacterales bacterium]|nr:GNAT family N-acetyltransferase [Desulfobacterales bacterium]
MDFSIRTHRPGDMGMVIHRHGALYAEEYGFNDQFDVYVAQGMADFMANRNPERERLWMAEKDGTHLGSIAIVEGGDNMAQLRWLIVEPDTRGMGVGRELVSTAVEFAWKADYSGIFLWTIDFLSAARKLYAGSGFTLKETKESRVWGKILREEKWEIRARSRD